MKNDNAGHPQSFHGKWLSIFAIEINPEEYACN
jgi:hypothetical protein